MLSTEDTTSAAVAPDTPKLITEHESVEGEDDWVVVKKQRIIFLVPPPSPLQPQVSAENCKLSGSGKIVHQTSEPPKRKHHKNFKGKHKKPAAEVSVSGTQAEAEVKISSRGPTDDRMVVHGSHQSLMDPMDHKANPLCAASCRTGCLQQVQAGHDPNGEHNNVHSKTRSLKLNGTERMIVGASNVMKLRLRALNFEKKLKALGGLRKWLVSQGLTQFLTVFERENFSMFQLVTLTMSKLKEMGIVAVGPRRKLIHAIDCLCQPYFIKASPMK